MRLIFIRHGETTGDVEDRYGGAYDDILSPAGEKQVLELAEELADAGIKKVFTSPLKRAQQTALGLAARVHCPITVINDLRERNQYGPLTGMTKSAALRQYPDFVDLVKDRNNTLPDAESYVEAGKRMQQAYRQVLAEAEDCAAVVWHGGGMRVLFREILKQGELSKIGDCCWVELDFATPEAEPVIQNHQRIVFDF